MIAELFQKDVRTINEHLKNYLPLADWRRRQSPFLLNVREEAVAA